MAQAPSARSPHPDATGSTSGWVKAGVVAGLGLLGLVIILSYLIWSSEQGGLGEAGRVDGPAPPPRGAGTSTLSHGGPGPVGVTGSSTSTRPGEPFLEPDYRPPQRSRTPRAASGGEGR